MAVAVAVAVAVAFQSSFCRLQTVRCPDRSSTRDVLNQTWPCLSSVLLRQAAMYVRLRRYLCSSLVISGLV